MKSLQSCEICRDCLQHPSSYEVLWLGVGEKKGEPPPWSFWHWANSSLLSLRTSGNTDLIHTHTNYCELKLMCYLSQAALSHLKLAWPLTAGRRYYFLLKTLIKQETRRSYFDQVEGSSGGLPSLFLVLVGNVHPSRWITSLCLTYWTKTSSYLLCTSLEVGFICSL